MLPDEFTGLFPEARQAGKSFPVFLLEVGGTVCEVAFARVERKTGRGYTGFEARCGKDITVEQDLVRRDTTINSMAMDGEGRIIDPYGGKADIERKSSARPQRPISPKTRCARCAPRVRLRSSALR